MKKKLESELISIAHRILKLTGKEDIEKMHNEIALLYQKITVLKFIENNHDGEMPDFDGMDSSFFNSLDRGSKNTITDTTEEAKSTALNRVTEEEEEEEDIMEPAIEKIKDMVAQMPAETIEVDTIIDTINESNDAVEHDLSELSPSYAQLPIFDAIDPEPTQTSLNDQLKTQGFQIGLNDRLAFVKNLFDNSTEDYDRVLSQLSTLSSHDEAINLLDSIIKPDYNNWEGQEEIEARFLEIIENKFK